MGNRELEGRVAIITGAAKGIGEATARLFAQEGVRLVAVDRDAAKLESVAAALREQGAEVATQVGDVAEPQTAEAAVRAAEETYGCLDILVNNAGIAFMATVLETTPEDWDRVLGTNLKSIYLFSRAAIPIMKRQGGGAIVNTASEAGIVGFYRYAAYSASKAGVVNLTRAMALDHAADQIRVNCVCPGSIETPLLQQYFDSFPDPAAVRHDDEKAHPLGIGQPIDIAYGILYLASPRAAYVTGHALVIDGGFTAQ